jgi:glycosyltransferase involved in cell wall biosynthesis
MKKPCKVLCLFDYKSYTGFSTVSTNIKKELKRYFGSDLHLDIVGINYFGEPFEEPDGTYVIPAVKSAPKKDDFGRFGFLKILNDSNEYDGIFIIQDLGVISPIIPILKGIKDEKKRNNKKVFKSMFYFPIDCKIIDKLAENLDFFDCLVTYTEYGRSEILRFRPEMKGKIKVVPHGNNSKHFYQLHPDDIKAFREEYLGKNANKFIITNVNRNQPRKDIPTTIFAFQEVKRLWKEQKLSSEPFLYLHMNPNDPLGWDLRAIFMQTDLVENVDYKLLDIETANKGASVEMVNKVYNASDVYVTTTLGEGWGLTLTEAMATCTPIICPLSTSFIEMTDKGRRAYVIDRLLPVCYSTDNIIREQCDYMDVADMIIRVAKGLQHHGDEYDFSEKHHDMLNRAYNWVNSLDWSEICKKWIDYFKETF